MTADFRRSAATKHSAHWWKADLRGFADRLHAVGWDYVSQNCEFRRQSHNATSMPKVP